MSHRFMTMGALVFALAVAALGASVAGQAPKDSGGKGIVPRIANGKPDLQGVWDFRTLTPLQRPTDLAGKEVLTDAEAVEYERKNALNQDNRESKPTTVQNGAASTTDVDRAYNDFWWDFGTRIAKQPSLVVDPPDGRIPAQTQEAQDRIAARRNRYDNVEERPLAERCILGFNSGPPMVRSTERMYEYACHEGNYALEDVLKGARYGDKKQ